MREREDESVKHEYWKNKNEKQKVKREPSDGAIDDWVWWSHRGAAEFLGKSMQVFSEICKAILQQFKNQSAFKNNSPQKAHSIII